MAIERLPVHNIHIPVAHYPSLPGKHVVPTAGMAAHLAAQLGEVIKNSSPAEKQRRLLQLKLLQNHLTSANQLQELRALQIGRMKKAQADQDAIESDIDAFRHKAFGSGGASEPGFSGDVNIPDPNSAYSVAGPQPDDPGDTTPPDYYGLT